MKKLQLFIILLVVIVLFTLADYHLNVPDGLKLPSPAEQQIAQEVTETPSATPVVTDPNITQSVLEGGSLGELYELEKRSRTTELFETFDLKGLSNTSIYSNLLLQAVSKSDPLYVYEVHGAQGQGKITYLNLKLQVIDQLGSPAGINETGDYGYNSFFYNDQLNQNTGFIVTQIGDIVLGFRYNKSSEKAFDSVQEFIEYYMSQINN